MRTKEVGRWLVVAVLGVGLMGATHLAAQEVKNPDTFIAATIGKVDSLDPAWAYDDASIAKIQNIYEHLIWYDRERTDRFVPQLATEVPSAENGLISPDGLTYTLPIRKGVKFHNGEILTPEDVEYSIERAMVQDRDGGPVWMLYEPLLGVLGSRDDEGNIVVKFEDVDKAVEVKGNNVIFHLNKPYPPFLAILAGGWCSIVNKKFVVEHGGWPGTAETWEDYNNPATGTATLQSIACGTGPFKLERWEPGVETVFVRFDEYWREPAKLKMVIVKVIEEWTTRKLMLMAGDVDTIYVPGQYRKELEGVEGIRIFKDLATLDLAAAFFNFKINPEGNTDIGSGTLDGNGIPPDFFSDKNVRLGFAHSFDWDTYLRDVFFGEAAKPVGPIPVRIAYRNPEQKTYQFDLKKAEDYFKKAWGGEVWKKGFQFTMLYNAGNTQRETAARMIEENVESLNPKFKIEVRPVEWANYVRELVRKKLTLFLIGWVADYPDAHNFVYPFMHSRGDFSGFQSYKNPIVDEIIKRGIETTDPQKRKTLYEELQMIYYDDVPSIPLHQMLRRHYETTWMKGYYFNPVYSENDVGAYSYPLSKGQ